MKPWVGPLHEQQVTSGYYVSVVDGRRKDLLLGPYDTREEAEANVERVRKWVTERDPKAHFYGFGTAKATAAHLTPGRLNHRMGMREGESTT